MKPVRAQAIPVPEQAPLVAGNRNTSLLKIIALVFMIIDHMGVRVFPHVPELRTIGRLAFPIYCYCIVVGACYTKCWWRYALRIAAVGLISQPIYIVAMNRTWQNPNIFLSLLLGLLGIVAIKEKKLYSHIWGPIAVLLLAIELKCDYGYRGVLLMMLMYAARQNAPSLSAVMIAFCLFWGSPGSEVKSFFGIPFAFLNFRILNSILPAFFRQQSLSLLSLPLMLMPLPQKFKMPTWLGYALYPAHLVLIWLMVVIKAMLAQ